MKTTVLQHWKTAIRKPGFVLRICNSFPFRILENVTTTDLFLISVNFSLLKSLLGVPVLQKIPCSMTRADLDTETMKTRRLSCCIWPWMISLDFVVAERAFYLGNERPRSAISAGPVIAVSYGTMVILHARRAQRASLNFIICSYDIGIGCVHVVFMWHLGGTTPGDRQCVVGGMGK